MENATFGALRVRDDPEVLTQFAHHCRKYGFDAKVLFNIAMYIDERRQLIRISKPFAMLDREITRNGFIAWQGGQSFMGEWRSGGRDTAQSRITWNEADDFCRFLTNQSVISNLVKPIFRLPSEAEWEIACRSGMNSPYSFGRDKKRARMGS